MRVQTSYLIKVSAVPLLSIVFHQFIIDMAIPYTTNVLVGA